MRRTALTLASASANTLGTGIGQPARARLRQVSGQSHPLVGAATRIGRLAGNEVVLDDAEVSRHHAVVSDTGATFVIIELRSANGVYLQDRRIRGSVALSDGHRVRIGQYEFVFETEARG